jgi:hypothetical protein
VQSGELLKSRDQIFSVFPFELILDDLFDQSPIATAGLKHKRGETFQIVRVPFGNHEIEGVGPYARESRISLGRPEMGSLAGLTSGMARNRGAKRENKNG